MYKKRLINENWCVDITLNRSALLQILVASVGRKFRPIDYLDHEMNGRWSMAGTLNLWSRAEEFMEEKRGVMRLVNCERVFISGVCTTNEGTNLNLLSYPSEST